MSHDVRLSSVQLHPAPPIRCLSCNGTGLVMPRVAPRVACPVCGARGHVGHGLPYVVAAVVAANTRILQRV